MAVAATSGRARGATAYVVATAGVVLTTLSASGCCGCESGRRNFTWPRRGAHLLVDTEGLVRHSGLSLVQHPPRKSVSTEVAVDGLLVSPEHAWEPYIYAYHSLVQVSTEELRIYYDAIGPDGRFLCVAVSTNAGKTFTKPMLGVVSFRGSRDNNIVLQGSPGNVFLDTNPHCSPAAAFKAVMNVDGNVQLFGSEDGFNFSSIASKCLAGSDTQNIVFYDDMQQGYVFFGRTHLPAGLGALPGGEPARNITPCYGAEHPGRSVGSFFIGQNLTAPWPVVTANSAPTILNTDSQDPPCMDTYTSAATPLHDAIFMFPQVYHHYPTTFIKQSHNPTYDDGLLEARLAVSRSGENVSYISRRAWLPRGVGQVRPYQTCFFDGEFDAASTAVAQGLWQVGDETWLVGWGAQYTHAGLDNWTMAASAQVKSGLQLLRIRRNRFVSLSTSPKQIATAGVLRTVSLSRPTHCNASTGFRLELNIVVEAGRGATIRLLDADGKLVAVSNPLVGIDDVALRIAWNVIGNTSRKVYSVDGCACKPVRQLLANFGHSSCLACSHIPLLWFISNRCY